MRLKHTIDCAQIRAYREQTGATQAETAAEIGISVSTLRKIEDSEQPLSVSAKVAHQVSQFLDKYREQRMREGQASDFGFSKIDLDKNSPT